MTITVVPIPRRPYGSPRPTLEDVVGDWDRFQLLASYGAGITLSIPRGEHDTGTASSRHRGSG
jgi:hypothetical protein